MCHVGGPSWNKMDYCRPKAGSEQGDLDQTLCLPLLDHIGPVHLAAPHATNVSDRKHLDKSLVASCHHHGRSKMIRPSLSGISKYQESE